MKKVFTYIMAIAAVICVSALIFVYLIEQREIIQIKNDLRGFVNEATRLGFSPEWKEIISEEKYPHLDYAKLKFATVLRKNLPHKEPIIVYKDAGRTYEAYLDGHISTHTNKP